MSFAPNCCAGYWTVRVASFVVATVVMACAVSDVLGWGGGHNDLQQAIVRRLPEDLQQHLPKEAVRESIEHWSHYPDSFETFQPEAQLIGPEGMQVLRENGIRRRYDLHHDRNRAVVFLLLVDSLKRQRYDAALLWIACLGHSTGDMVACNHDPLVHVATYDWPEVDAALPGGTVLARLATMVDLHPVVALDGGAAAFDEAIDAMRLADDQRDATAALLDIMMYGNQGAAFCSQHGVGVLQQAALWLDRQEPDARRRLQHHMSRLGAWGAVRVVRDVEVAWRLAQQKAEMPSVDEVQKVFEQRTAQWVREHRLDDEALFVPVLRPAGPTTKKAVAVVLEPTWRMNEGMFAAADRVIAVAICRTLAAAGVDYVTVDSRELADRELPSPEQLSAVVVVGSRFHDYHGLKAAEVDRHLKSYLDRGGRVLWIGGTSLPASSALAPLRAAMKKDDNAKWPAPLDEATNWQLCLADSATETAWQFVRSPQTPAGWHVPRCPWRFELDDHDELQPLLTLRLGASSSVVGAMCGGARVAWLPVYAVHPYLLTRPKVIREPSEPQLDAAGATILLDALKRLN